VDWRPILPCALAGLLLTTQPALGWIAQAETAAVSAKPASSSSSNAAPTPTFAEADSDTDVTHYYLDIEIIPEYTGPTVTAVRVEGVSTIDLMPTVDGLSTFTVDLHGGLTVNSVTGDLASWTRISDTIEITLDRAYDTGEAIQVIVDYAGYPQSGGLGAFHWWIRNGTLAVATASVPFYARYQWPCKDALDDKATVRTHVTVPAGLRALSNGAEQVPLSLPGGRMRYRWNETHPMIPYLASLAVANYEDYEVAYEYDDGGTPQTMPAHCYLYPEHWDAGAGEPLPDHKLACDTLLQMLETMSDLFGPYPFLDEKYGVVETGQTGGLNANIEYQTVSSLWQIDNNGKIMSHELGHQWWGNLLTCETWYDVWLNEGFASYTEALYHELRPQGTVTAFWSRVNARRPADPDARSTARTSRRRTPSSATTMSTRWVRGCCTCSGV
jgi:aminopeptidase N